MTFGQKITIARKTKDWTQTELGNAIGTSRDIVGKYERDEIKPSIEVAAKVAEVLDLSLDYLVRDITPSTNNIEATAEQLKQLQLLERLSDDDKAHVFAVITAFTAKAKLESIMK